MNQIPNEIFYIKKHRKNIEMFSKKITIMI